MNRSIIAFVFTFLLLACEKDSQLAFEHQVFDGGPCTACPKIRIEIPRALTKRKIGQTINNALTEEVISQLAYEEYQNAATIPSAIESFKNGYRDLQQKFPEEYAPWEATIHAKVSFENKDLISISLTSYIYTGGAHGYGSTHLLNFDKDSGRELETEELFSDWEGFMKLAESQFRTQHQIAKGQAINSTGFMFESDTFYLPENIGYTESGLMLLYNPYEIASYADGVIELELPYKKVENMLVVRP